MRRPAALAFLVLLLAPAVALAEYRVLCINIRVEVDTRGPEQFPSGRGMRVCQLGPTFPFLSDANDHAQRTYGGPGRACRCR